MATCHKMTRFDHDQTVGLPDPVQRYLHKVIPNGFPFIQFAELTHHGRFKTNPTKDWMPIRGKQFFSTQTPGFIWRGKTKLFQADDRYFDDEGRLRVQLLSVIPFISIKGGQIDESELQRWMGEHFWFPTNLLNQDLFDWEAIDDRSSRLTLRYREFEIPMTIYFGKDDLISRVSCQRFKEKGKRVLWSGLASDYNTIDGLLVPTRVQARWHLPDEVFTYADFTVESLHFHPSPQKNMVAKELPHSQVV